MPGLNDQYSVANITYSCTVLQKLKLIPPHKSVQQKKGLQKKFF
jgi:hypothetical protein